MTKKHIEHPLFAASTAERAQENTIAPELVDDYLKMNVEVILEKVLPEN